MRDGAKPVKLTVVVPAYNVVGHVSATLDSLANQDVPIHEVVIVDDGSVDDTRREIEDYLRGHPVGGAVLISQENQGVSAARNAGLRVATGDYVLFLDADDLVDSRLVSTLDHAVSAFGGQPDVISWRFEHRSAVRGRLTTYDKYWRSERPVIAAGPEVLQFILRDRTHWIWTASAAYRTDFLRTSGLDFTVGCFSGQDLEFIWKSLALAGPVLWVDESLSTYMVREDSVTNSFSPRRLDDVRAFQRVSQFLADSADSRVNALAVHASRKIVPHYLDNLKRMCRTDLDPREIMEAVECRHPGLAKEMRQLTWRDLWMRGRAIPDHLMLALWPYLGLKLLKWKVR